jgi:hypothetical protein
MGGNIELVRTGVSNFVKLNNSPKLKKKLKIFKTKALF